MNPRTKAPALLAALALALGALTGCTAPAAAAPSIASAQSGEYVGPPATTEFYQAAAEAFPRPLPDGYTWDNGVTAPEQTAWLIVREDWVGCTIHATAAAEARGDTEAAARAQGALHTAWDDLLAPGFSEHAGWVGTDIDKADWTNVSKMFSCPSRSTPRS